MEAVVGILFLVACLRSPKELPPKRPSRFGLRNLALLFFAISTYSIATVKGFGWILMILGYAQTEENESRARLGYLAVFILLQLYKLPYLEAISALTN